MPVINFQFLILGYGCDCVVKVAKSNFQFLILGYLTYGLWFTSGAHQLSIPHFRILLEGEIMAGTSGLSIPHFRILSVTPTLLQKILTFNSSF